MSRSVQFIAVVVAQLSSAQLSSAVAHKVSTAPQMWRPQWWWPADTDDIITPLLPPPSSYLSYRLSQASSSVLIVHSGVGGEDTSQSQYYMLLHCTYS